MAILCLTVAGWAPIDTSGYLGQRLPDFSDARYTGSENIINWIIGGTIDKSLVEGCARMVRKAAWV